MRVCTLCKVEGRPEVDPNACDCGTTNLEVHRPGCAWTVHSVRRYVVRIPRTELTLDKTELQPYYKQQGWQLLKDGERFYRWKNLCRNCIRLQEDALSRKQEYLKACKAARGLDDKTYSQMLAQQGS